MSDIEIIKKYGSIENYIYELEQENKELKEGNTIYNQFVNYKNWYFDYVDKYENLQQENQQLKDKINTYENPEDLTLMFMYCDEKAKNKIKQLKEVIEEVREYIKRKDICIDIRDEELNCISTNELLQILDKVGDIDEKKN